MLGIKKETETQVSTVKIAFWYVVSNLLVKGLDMITTPIFTRVLSQSDYGEFSNFTSWESILFVILSFQFHATVPRAKYDFEGKMDKYLSSITATSNMITIALYVVVEWNKGFFESFFAMDIVYIRILFIYLFFSPAFTFLQIKHRIYSKYKLFVALAIGSAGVRTGVSVITVFLMKDGLAARMIGYVVPITILNIIIWSIILIRGKAPSWTCAKYALVIAFPLLQNAIAANLLGTSDRVMIKQFCGADKTAIYTLAYSCASVVSLIWTSMNQAWTPWLFDKLHEQKYNEVHEKSKWYFGCFVAMVIPVLLVIPEVVLIMGGKAYYEARFIMPAIIIGGVFQFVYGLYVNIETYEKKTWLIVKGTMLATVINIVLNFLLIPRLGYWIAAYTTLIGYLALMLFHWHSVKKMKLYDNVYDEKFILISVVFLFVLHGICILLYQWIVIRYIILVLYAGAITYIGYKNKELLLGSLNLKRKRK